MVNMKLEALKAKFWALNAENLKISLRNHSKAPNKKESSPKPVKKFKQGWREIGGNKIFFRSQWEANYGFYLQWKKERKEILEWHHEPQTFWFEGIRRGCVTYLPDFKVIALNGTHEWIEVKGFMDAKSLTKIKRFKKFFPKEKLCIVDAKWYKKNCKNLSLIVPGWEKG